ncbi:MAG: Rieske 2Fe-2S domain-containing protein [Pseudolabrys sp.]
MTTQLTEPSVWSRQAGTRSFPLNAWYVAAWSRDVEHRLLARTICGKKVVMYRTGAGRVAALEDACWHRLVPLSKGRLDGDQVVCGYHGLVFNAAGRCTFMPSQETINPSACVRAFPAVEKHGFVWIFMGDPALADPAKIADMHWVDDAAWAGEGRMTPLACNYRLVVDNLMDLTHEAFVHTSSIGNSAVAEAPFEVTHGERTARVVRWMLGIEPPPFWRFQLGQTIKSDGKVDRWQFINFEAPAAVVLDVGVALAGSGAPQGDRSQGVTARICHFITPETESTCFFFWVVRRNFRLDDAELTIATRDKNAAIVAEDEAVLSEQQKAMDANPDAVFYNLNIDGGAMWARRIVERMIEAETPPLALREAG